MVREWNAIFVKQMHKRRRRLQNEAASTSWVGQMQSVIKCSLSLGI